MYLIEEITVENLDEYKGVVAGLIDEIGIVEVINQKLGVDNREKIAAGQVINERERQAYYGALDYQTKEFIVQELKKWKY